MNKRLICFAIIPLLLFIMISDIRPEESDETEEIYLNFEDATLSSVVNFIGQQKKINIVPHKNLETLKVSLSTRTPYTLDQAWDVLLTLLEANQFSLVNVQGIYRIVPANVTKQQPLPIHMGSLEKLPDSDKVIRFVYLFKNIHPENVKPILEGILTPGAVYYNTNLNTCVITEKALNIKRAMIIINELDRGGLRESIKIVPLKQASADRIAEFITKNLLGEQQQQPQRIIQPQQRQETAFFSKNIKVIPDPYNNALIMLGTAGALDRLIEFVQLELDKPLEAEESRLHIKELKYMYAEKLKPLLDAIIKPPTKDPKTQIIGSVKYFEDMTIAAEQAPEAKEGEMASFGTGNRLIIACNKDDWQRIERFIDKIDKPQPQVAMEVLFVDVKVNSDKALGAQLANKKLGQLGNHIHAETQHIASQTPSAGVPNMINIPAASTEAQSGAAWLSAGREASAWAVAKMLFKSNNLNIISQPYLVANNHQKCELIVSTKRNIGDKVTSESTTAVSTKKEVPATLQVELTPSINSDGIINLNVSIKIDEFQTDFSEGVQTTGDRTNRHIQTQATMVDGEVLILGGLIRTRTLDTIYKTPILGDIPLIGNFFKHRTQTLTKEDLHVFIRPTLIKPRFEGSPGDYTQLKLDYAKIQIGRQADLLSTKDPIQRWFFNTDKKADDFKQIDGYSEGKYQPRSVIIPIDPYYKTKTSRTIQRLEKRRKKFTTETTDKKEV